MMVITGRRLAAALSSLDAEPVPSTCTFGENRSFSSHGRFPPLRRFPYRSGRRRSRGAVRSFDLLRVLATPDSQTPCRVDVDLHLDRDQVGFGKAGAESDLLDVERLASNVRAVCSAWAEPDRLGCVLPVSGVRPFRRSAGRSPGWVAVCFFMLWNWALVRRFCRYSRGPSRGCS